MSCSHYGDPRVIIRLKYGSSQAGAHIIGFILIGRLICFYDFILICSEFIVVSPVPDPMLEASETKSPANRFLDSVKHAECTSKMQPEGFSYDLVINLSKNLKCTTIEKVQTFKCVRS